MKIWTIEHKYKFVSFATESLAYKHIGKIIRDHLHEAFRAEDPLNATVLFLLNNEQFKLAYQVTEKHASNRSLGIRIIEQELLGHVME